jgi:hypothetical protein
MKVFRLWGFTFVPVLALRRMLEFGGGDIGDICNLVTLPGQEEDRFLARQLVYFLIFILIEDSDRKMILGSFSFLKDLQNGLDRFLEGE